MVSYVYRCSRQAAPLPNSFQSLLCQLLTSVRVLAFCGVVLGVVVAVLMPFILTRSITNTPRVANVSGMVSLVAALTVGAATACWVYLIARLQEVSGLPFLPYGMRTSTYLFSAD